MRVGGLFCELQFLTEFSIRHYPLTGLWFGEEWGKLDESDKGRQRLLRFSPRKIDEVILF